MARIKAHTLIIGSALLIGACSKPAKPSAIGPHSVFYNEPDGTALIVNPDNGLTQKEPNREAAQALVPWRLGSEVNPPCRGGVC
jgi:hypothetical protein